MAVGLARRERPRDYGTATCRVCKREFERTSGNSAVCRDPACQKARRQQTQRRHEAKRKTRRALRPHEQVLRDTAQQLTLDGSRGFAFAQLEARWLAVVTGRRSLDDEDAQVAYRQTLIDLASALIRLASELPAPTLEPRFDPGAKAQATRLAATAMAVG